MQGQTINGYTLQYRLGEGGMAEVWYAENEIGKPAAVKILNENLSRKSQIVERFHNEALVMVKLDHPNIRQVYGYGYLGDRHCIIMEYLDGKDLGALLQEGRQFSDEELRRWWNQTVDALNYTHAMGIVHRDIKPSNLFLDKKDNIKLLDFGIAKVKESMSMTRTGMTMGTLMYMSPEQVKDPKRVGAKSDIYSLAVSFVHLLTGKPIYDSDTSSEYDIQVNIVTQPVDLSAVPASWRGFLEPYLEKDPDKRPALRPFEEVQSSNDHLFETVSVGLGNAATGDKTQVSNNVDALVDKPYTAAPTAEMPVSNETSLNGEQPDDEKKEKPKSKLGLWLGIGAAVLALLIGLGYLLYINNDAEHLYNRSLKCYYENGDIDKAITLMTKAAEKDHVDAQCTLAHWYLDSGTSSGTDEAKKWFLRAAEKGNLLAQVDLATLYEYHYNQYDEALNWYRSAAATGDSFSQYKVGYLYETQYKDYESALEWYRTAADNNSIDAETAYTELRKKVYGINVPVNGVTFLMKYVEGGTFQMGSNDIERGDDENPVHSVTVSSFFIGETVVTQALWKAVMGSEPYYEEGWTNEFGYGDNYPAYRLNFNDWQDFIRKLNQLTGMDFRMPTEAEWEFAAKGGNKSNGYKYAGSDNMDNVGWYWKNSGVEYINDADNDWDWLSVDYYECKTHPVKMKEPNELGLYDMSGNVWEWCKDWYGSYNSSAQIDPQGPSSGYSHVLRGGSWMAPAKGCRSTDRNDRTPSCRYEYDGLRLVLPQ